MSDTKIKTEAQEDESAEPSVATKRDDDEKPREETLEDEKPREETLEDEEAKEDQKERHDEEDKEDKEDEEDEEEDEEGNIKVTIEDFDVKTIQKQPQQAKQVAPPLLEASQAIDISTLEDKPWRMPGADINDYFNYGFDEGTWRIYCDKQKRMKSIVNEIVDVQAETYRIPVVNEMIHVMPTAVPPVVIHPSRESNGNLRDLSPMEPQQPHGRPRRDRQQQISPSLHHQQRLQSGDRGGGGGRSRDHRETSGRDRHSRSPHTKERERKHSRSRKRSKSRERRRSRSKDRAERVDRSERSERSERADRSDRAERIDRTDRTDRTDRAERADRTDGKKRRSRSREREDDRRSKRHKSSRRA